MHPITRFRVTGQIIALASLPFSLFAETPSPLTELAARAGQGDVAAMVEMGNRYAAEDEDAPDQDFAAALKWYLQAAAKNNPEAQYHLAGLYYTGTGVAKDEAQARTWMQKSADAGFPEAQAAIGHDHAANEEYAEALRWFLKAAVQGHASAQYQAGQAYAQGLGTPVNNGEAAKWLRRAANSGLEDASYEIFNLSEADPQLAEKVIAAADGATKELIAKAEKGDVRAQIELYDLFATGLGGLLEDAKRGSVWLRKAAETGNAEAQTKLGLYYSENFGGERSGIEAGKWFEKAVAQNYLPAFTAYANLLKIQTEDTKQDHAAAQKWLVKAAELGDAEAQLNAGTSFLTGYGIPKNRSEGIRWLTAAAEQGNTSAMLTLVRASLEPGHVDTRTARTWLEKAENGEDERAQDYLNEIIAVEAEEKIAADVPSGVTGPTRALFIKALAGDAEAQFKLGVNYGSGGMDGLPKDLAAQARWYRRSAEQGYVFAQRNLAQVLMKGEGVPRDDAEAFKWMSRAAERGDQPAIYYMGTLYRDGRGVAKNPDEAVRWLTRAAEQNSFSAQRDLAALYLNGDGVPKNEATAVTWLLKTASQKDADAMMTLSELYAKGIGGASPDGTQAQLWLEKAAAQGNAKARAQVSAQKDAAKMEKLAGVQTAFEQAYAAADSLKGREKAVAEFTRAVGSAIYSAPLTKQQAFEFVMKSLTPRINAAPQEAGALFMVIDSAVFDGPALTGMVSPAAAAAIRAHATEVSARYARSQAAANQARPLFDKARSGDAEAQFQLGTFFTTNVDAKDEKQAEEWFKKAAANGHAGARQHLVKKDLEIGIGHLQANQFKEAAAGFEKAAANGNTSAMILLGAMLEEGDWGEEDFVNAKRWFNQALAAGDKRAEDHLKRLSTKENAQRAGEFFELGSKAYAAGDFATARAQWKNSADLQDMLAMFNLGVMNARGEGAAADLVAAKTWYEKAVAAGEKTKAPLALKEIAENKQGTTPSSVQTVQAKPAGLMESIKAIATWNNKNYAQSLVWYAKAANAGNINAANSLALIHLQGIQTPPDEAKALAWFKKAAERGDPVAAEWVDVLTSNKSASEKAAFAFEKGRPALHMTGGTTAFAMLSSWLRYAASLGHTEAKAFVEEIDYVQPPHAADTLYQQAKAAYTAKNYTQGMKLLLDAAAQDNPNALHNLGYVYEYGIGTAVDLPQSVQWYEKAAEKKAHGARRAAIVVRRIIFFREGNTAYSKKQYTEAHALWEKAAELGEGAAMMNLGVLYQDGSGVPKDNARALAWFEKAAKYNTPDAAASVESMKSVILVDEGVVAYRNKNYDEARSAWEKAATQGRSVAMFNLGVMEEQLLNYALAINWYEKAAKAGYPEAPAAVARLQALTVLDYADDEFDEGRYDSALKSYTQHAQNGNVKAMKAIAAMYENGNGMTADKTQAIAWYKKASDKGDIEAMDAVQRLEGTSAPEALAQAENDRQQLRDRINGIASAAPAPAPANAKNKEKTLRKHSPWTYDQLLAALKEGADHNALAAAIRQDKLDKLYALDIARLGNTPEGRSIEDFSALNTVLLEHAIPGAGAWTYELAKSNVEARRKVTGRNPTIVDSPELRARVAAGDVAALFQLIVLVKEKDPALGAVPTVTREELSRKLIEANYAPGFWYVADTYRNNVDKTKNDPVLEAEYVRKSAEAGDPRGMRALGMLFIAPGDKAVATNYAEAEYWLIEAAARAPEGTMEELYENPGRDVAFFYSYSIPHGGPVAWPVHGTEDHLLRWARELLRRGGKLADVAHVNLDSAERDPSTKDARKKMAALAPEGPALTEADVLKLDAAAKAGDAGAALKLGEALAGGRGVRQHDARGVTYYQLAAAKGSVKAMRALAYHYENGFGVKKDGAQRVAWLEKAGAAGDASAWREAADLHHYTYNDTGIKTDYAHALADYEKAIALGDAASLYSVALMHEYGRGVPKDMGKAEAFIIKAAEKNHVEAWIRLAGMASEKGDHKTAIVWYQKAIAAGHENARFWIAEQWVKAGDLVTAKRVYLQLAESGEGGASVPFTLAGMLEDEGDLAGAIKWYRTVATHRGAYDFMVTDSVRMARELEEEMNAKPETIPYYRRLAKTGDVEAKYKLGRMIFPTDQKDGMGWIAAAAYSGHAEATAVYYADFSQKDKAGASKWIQQLTEHGNMQAVLILGLETAATDKPAGLALLQKAADGGNAEAKYRLGGLLLMGQEFPKDLVRGVALITESAESGFALAQYELGRNLITGGFGLPAQPSKGVEWLNKAATKGLPQAMAVLGEVYERGVPGTAINLREALKWYKQAEKAGVPQMRPAILRVEILISLSGKTPPPQKK